ncbi:MAG: DNA repair protein RecN [Oscillospiraceae bacterium]|jgi:DNA repair protein RecN (Recombination protein N)|nr:DNA repair protein RecN [Oscillospiraceae bacterium]
MLETLTITNLALIERAEITFASGLNVLTGETGAGKSIVVDAISCVAGARSDRDLVRTGAEAMTVTAEFSDADVAEWLAENDVEPDDSLIITRRVTRDGKSSARVNGFAVTTAQLRELGSRLIDVHGQNDGRRLLDESAHLGSLDAFGGYADALRTYAAAYAAVRENARALAKIVSDESERARRTDTLRAQIDEIESVNPRVGETAELEQRRAILQNAEKLSAAFDGAYRALYGGSDSDGAAALLRDAESHLASAADYSDDYAKLLERARGLRYEADDLAESVRDVRRSADFSPTALDAVLERLAALSRLSRKFGDESQCLTYLDTAKSELDTLEFSDERRRQLEKERDTLLAAAIDAASAVTQHRRDAAERLRARIEDELRGLAMPNVRFAVEFVPEPELTAHGAENARFLMSANAGEEPGKVAKIASGGELSRIMLALKNVLSETDPTDVTVFDEIDAGVSGIAAQRVGEKLATLARAHQVLCVTHLPQIAAIADAHYEISKASSGDDGDVRTFTSVRRLDRAGRRLELARLTGGDNVTQTTLDAAEEALVAAEKYRQLTVDC